MVALPARKRRICCTFVVCLSWESFSIGFLGPQATCGRRGLAKGKMHSIPVLNAFAKNSGEDNGEEPGGIADPSAGSDDDDDDGDDTVRLPTGKSPRSPGVLLPRQLPRGVLVSAEESRRRATERSLLEALRDGDDAVGELRDFWRAQPRNYRDGDKHETEHERGERFREAALGIGDPSSWERSREVLESLCGEDPTFLQAFALLSKLYCLEGKLEDSRAVALEVLKLKPWHFLAIETMVATSYALNKINASVFWASRRLPPPGRAEQRSEWIDRAIGESLELEARIATLEVTGGDVTGGISFDWSSESDRTGDDDPWQ